MKLSKLKSYLLALLFIGGVFVSCSDDESDTTTPMDQGNGNNNSGVSLPASVKGQVVNMKFTAAQMGAPYTENQEFKFTFSSSGMLFIDDDPAANDGDEITLSSPSLVGNEYVWTDASNDFSYALSLKSDSSINEVNLSQTSSSSFLGQFIPTNSGGGASMIAAYAGTYTVTSVDKGTHSRMTVIIDASGNIDFDSNVQLMVSDFALVSDRLDCCDGIWIDMNPWPTEPYQRVNLFIDSTSNTPNKIEYMPEYPSISNRVHVNF